MPPSSPSAAIIPIDRVQQHILLIRGQRVIIGIDLARLYGVTTKRLNEAVRRNARRFPEDFMFQLTWEETAILRSQIATLRSSATDARSRPQIAALKAPHGKHLKYRPYAFTEHGAIMAATVLNSPLAVDASLFVVRAFVKLRELLFSHHQLAAKLDELERKLQNHDDQILTLFDAIRQLMEEPDEPTPPKPPVGFHTELLPAPHPKAKRK